MRMEDVFFMGCYLNAFVSGAALVPFDKSPVPILEEALIRELKYHHAFFLNVKASKSQGQIHIPIRTGPGLFEVGRQRTQYLRGKYLKTEKRKHQLLKSHLPVPPVRSNFFVILMDHQVSKFMYQGNQEPVWIRIIVD